MAATDQSRPVGRVDEAGPAPFAIDVFAFPAGANPAMRWMAESLAFAAKRLTAQSEHLVALGRCGSIVEAQKLTAAYLARAASDCQHEAGTFLQKITGTK